MDGTIQLTGHVAKPWRRRERSGYLPRNAELRGERTTYMQFGIARERAPTFGTLSITH